MRDKLAIDLNHTTLELTHFNFSLVDPNGRIQLQITHLTTVELGQ